jgi:hypothetical protein
LASGASEESRSIMRSRSETQYPVAASVKKIATTAFVALCP